MNREVIENKLSKEIDILGFKIWYNRNENEYTREQEVNGKNKKIIFRLYDNIWYW